MNVAFKIILKQGAYKTVQTYENPASIFIQPIESGEIQLAHFAFFHKWNGLYICEKKVLNIDKIQIFC